MIVANLENLSQQLAMRPAFQKAIDFLQSQRWHGQPDGRVEIDGDQVYALLQSYITKVTSDKIPFEGHRKYIDVQYIVEGKETLYWLPANCLTLTTPYDEAKDIWFSHSPDTDSTPMVLAPGQLAVFFPEDAHAPTHAVGAPAPVKKIVVKVAV